MRRNPFSSWAGNRFSVPGKNRSTRAMSKPVCLSIEALEQRTVPTGSSTAWLGTVSPLEPLRVVLVSDAVADAEQIAAAAAPGVVAVTYESATASPTSLVDLVQRVAAARGGARIGRLGLAAHGHAGHVQLGTESAWSWNSMPETVASWQALRPLLAPGAQLELYVCNLAAGPGGRAFVNALAAATGASVVASDNPVGSADRGDFIWEYVVGQGATTEALLSADALERLPEFVLDDAYEENDNLGQVSGDGRLAGTANAPRLGLLTAPRTLSELWLDRDEDWFQFQIARGGATSDFVRMDFTCRGGQLGIDLIAEETGNAVRRGWTGCGNRFASVDFGGLPSGTYYARIHTQAGRSESLSYTLTISPPAAPHELRLVLDATALSEAAGDNAVTGHVIRSGPLAQALDVRLENSRPGDVTAPASVRIEAGQSSASFRLGTVNNTRVDGTRTMTLAARAAGYTDTNTTLEVLDDDRDPSVWQFSAATYTANERDGRATITITRTTPGPDPATISYATSDGTARAGVDYTAAAGTLTFQPGELSKTFAVPITNSAVVKRDRTLRLVLSDPSGGSTLGSPSAASLILIDKDLPTVAATALPSNAGQAGVVFAKTREAIQNVVITAYRNYLKRDPDAAGQENWVQGMFRGLTEERLEASFIGSAEFIDRSGGRGRGWIVAMYRELLGRNPGEPEVQAWLDALRNGTAEADVAYGFAASREREEQRIQRNYRHFLERDASKPEVDGWVDLFVRGQATNQDIIAGFVSSPEYYGRSSKGRGNQATWVVSAYEDVLGRSPHKAEVEQWLVFLK